MKVIIPTNDNLSETTICPSFGRAPYFLICDTESNTKTFLENLAADSAGGAGIAAAQSIVDSKAEVLLTPRCGENAAKVLQMAGIRIVKTSGQSVDENVTAYLAGKLSNLTEIHPGFHHHGHQGGM